MALNDFKYKLDEEAWLCYPCNICIGEDYTDRCPLYYIQRGINLNARGIHQMIRCVTDGRIPLSREMAEFIYTCPMCGNCSESCLLRLKPPMTIRNLRAALVDAGFGPMKGHKSLISGMANYSNPWMVPRARKGDWAKKLDIKDATKEHVEVLYYVGCTEASIADLQQVARSAAKVLKRAGVDFGIMGSKEECCGTIAYQVGDFRFFEQQAKRNIESINRLNVKKVVTACAGCFKILKNVYPHQGLGELNSEVMHLTEFLDKLIKEGNLRMSKEVPMKVTYHDPCHLGSESMEKIGVYEAPRSILKSIPGVKFIEMQKIRELAWCCGAGGGVKSGAPEVALKIVRPRLEEAVGTKAEALVSACPFCEQHLGDGIKMTKERLVILDVAELVDKAL